MTATFENTVSESGFEAVEVFHALRGHWNDRQNRRELAEGVTSKTGESSSKRYQAMLAWVVDAPLEGALDRVGSESGPSVLEMLVLTWSENSLCRAPRLDARASFAPIPLV